MSYIFYNQGKKYYNLFISHSWKYADQYDRLVALLDAKDNFDFKNYSIPMDDPINDTDSDKELKEAIRNHISPASCVIVLAGVYATYSKWINIEIELAQEMGKKILAVKIRGNVEVSTVVSDAADEIVNWNTDSIVEAIRRLCD
ncbi:MAG: TIR domain-containing protein [Clostridia bacterium]|nr:TIR domain-containing protein [Clostridia bacterium]